MNKFYDLKFSDKIPQMRQYCYFKKNKAVFGLLEFINDYINQVLKEENKQEFEKQDFNLMEGYVENLKKYQKVAEDIIGKEISLEVVEKIIFGQSVEEFEEFFERKGGDSLFNKRLNGS